jgi:DNA invertase Pin-like site-specific DNA recombinase
MMRAVVYLRVSTDEQAASGLGLDAQLHACRAWAEREGAEALGPFVEEEGVGGATPLEKRTRLVEAIDAVGRGDVLLVAKRDRVARDPILTAMIEAAVKRRGGRLVSAAGEGTATDDPDDVLMRRIVDAFAEYERLIITARTRAALAAKRRRGERTGQVPYGAALDPDGPANAKGRPVRLRPDPAEANTVADVRAWRAAGWSLRRIARELDARGVPTKNGGLRWSPNSVRHLSRRPDEPVRPD